MKLNYHGILMLNERNPGFAEHEVPVNRERSLKLWFKLLDYWFEVFYMDPNLYLKWSEEDGWCWYHRQHVLDIRVVLNSEGMLHSTFVESITDVEEAFLRALGFASFFEYNNPGTPTSDKWIVYGKLMMANGNVDSPIWFDHLYDRLDPNDPDSRRQGDPYRTMVQWIRTTWTEVNLYYKYTTRVITTKGN